MKDDRPYLIHFDESIDRIQSCISDLDFPDFMKQPLVQDAVLRNLQVLAESTQRLSENFKSTHPEIEWYKIAGLRNILVHDYLSINLATVWGVVKEKLPELHVPIRTALR